LTIQKHLNRLSPQTNTFRNVRPSCVNSKRSKKNSNQTQRREAQERDGGHLAGLPFSLREEGLSCMVYKMQLSIQLLSWGHEFKSHIGYRVKKKKN